MTSGCLTDRQAEHRLERLQLRFLPQRFCLEKVTDEELEAYRNEQTGTSIIGQEKPRATAIYYNTTPFLKVLHTYEGLACFTTAQTRSATPLMSAETPRWLFACDTSLERSYTTSTLSTCKTKRKERQMR